MNSSSTPFSWPSLIAQVKDESFGIPPDVIFKIAEDDQIKEVKAHKLILSMVSPMFKKMFFTTDVGDKTAKEIDIKETTFSAFQIMMNVIYNTESLEDSLESMSVQEVFDVVNLIERYQIEELQQIIEKHISNYPLTEDTVLDVAAKAMEYSNLFQTEAQHILLTCAKFLKPKLIDTNSIFRYISENINRKEVVSILLAKIYENSDIPQISGPLIEKLELKSPCTGVANIFIGDSLLVDGLSTQGSSAEEPLDWYLLQDGKTQQGFHILQNVLKKEKYRRAKQIRVVFAFGHNDWRNYPAVSNILRNCSSLARQQGARISFVAPVLPLREVLNSTGCEWRRQWYQEYSEMKASIKKLNNENGVVANFYPYEAVIGNKYAWATDGYHFGQTQVNQIIQLIRKKAYRNSIFY